MNILILSPHTDDAEIGAGATISKYIDAGHNILWVVFSTCEESLPEGMDKDTLKKEFKSVVDFLKVESITFGYKVRKLNDHRQEVLEDLRKIRADFEPDLVIGPSLNDFHQDHQVVANEMVRAFKTTCSIICYELPWNHLQYNTQMFVRFDRMTLEKKIHLVNFYSSQMEVRSVYFKQDFIRSLATVRGAQINSDYAEAFEVIRWIINFDEDSPTFCL